MTSDLVLLELLLVATVAVAALIDVRTGHIPNWLTLGGLLVGLTAHAVLGLIAEGSFGAATALVGALLGVAATVAVPLLLYRTGGVGGGDVKLLAAVGALCGATRGLEVELYAFTIAAVYVGALMALRGVLWRALRAAFGLVPALLGRGSRTRVARGASLGQLRFGPSVLVAACLAVCSHWGGTP